MDSVLHWSIMLKPIKTKYPKGSRGRPPILVETLLRIYFMQQWYALSDPAMEDWINAPNTDIKKKPILFLAIFCAGKITTTRNTKPQTKTAARTAKRKLDSK